MGEAFKCELILTNLFVELLLLLSAALLCLNCCFRRTPEQKNFHLFSLWLCVFHSSAPPLLFFHSMLLLLTHIAREESASSSNKWKEFVWNCSINVWLKFLYLCELFATRSWKQKSQKTTTTSSLKSDKVHDALTRYARFWLLEKTCWAFSFSYYVHEIVSRSREYEWNRASRSFFSSAAHNSQLSIHYLPRNLQSVLSSWGWHEHGTVLSIVFSSLIVHYVHLREWVTERVEHASWSAIVHYYYMNAVSALLLDDDERRFARKRYSIECPCCESCQCQDISHYGDVVKTAQNEFVSSLI